MSPLPTPTARRLTAPSWKDARLLVGILLVLLSVVLGAVAMSAADDRVGVWAAKGEITPGQQIEESDLVRVDVQLGDAAPEYVLANERLPNGAVMGRELHDGELLPRAAVVDPVDLRVSQVAVHVEPAYLSNLVKGSRVSVHAVDPRTTTASGTDEQAADDRPRYEEIVERATVHALPTSGGGVMTSASGSTAIIVVPDGVVNELLSLDTRETPIKLVLESGSPEKKDG